MSGAGNSVDVTVRGTTTHIARAGHGREAFSASSTMSAYEAAMAAARKYLRCPRNRIVVAYAGEHEGATRFVATRHDSPISTLWVHFDDQGQDFLSWEIVAETGHIIDSYPFQYTIWARCKVVDPRKLEVGDCVVIETPEGARSTIKYPIVKIGRKRGAS